MLLYANLLFWLFLSHACKANYAKKKKKSPNIPDSIKKKKG